jgi:hypothetical protein
MPHPQPALLRAVDEGVLPEEVAREVRDHLAECEICVQLRDDLTSLAESTTPQHHAGRNRWWTYAAVAATAAAAVIVILWPPEPAPIAQRIEPPVLLTYRLPLELAPLRLPLDSALTLRGERNSTSVSYLTALGAALEPYRKGSFHEAAIKLRALGTRSPQAMEPPFYLGVSLLLSGDAKAAAATLQEAQQIGGEALKEDVVWYLAIAYERSGAWQQARVLVEQVCKGSGRHSGAACEALSR